MSTRFDLRVLVLGLILGIGSLSLITIWTISPSFLLSHVTTFVLAFVGMVILVNTPFHLWKRLAWILYGSLLILLLLTAVQQTVAKGAARWLRFGSIQVQPSQIMLPIFTLSSATLLYHRAKKKGAQFNLREKTTQFKIAGLLAAPILVFLQPNLSTALLLMVSGVLVYFYAGYPLKYILYAGVALGLLAGLGWVGVLQEYQKNRVISFLDPTVDELGIGYNARQSQVAVGAGGLAGQGLWGGSQAQLGFLPEKHTDFVFAAYAEQFGFVGSSILLLLFLILFLSLFAVASSQKGVHRLYSFGYLSILVGYFTINVGMNIGLLPVTGLPLPFFSTGGSSLLAFGLGVGLILSKPSTTS